MAQEELSAKVKSKPKPISETRKIRKPLMERKRRERINASLNELARLLTEANKVKQDGGKATKLEKADILELTVQHLESLNQPQEGKRENLMKDEKFQEGFGECIKVVEKVLKPSTSQELSERLLTHLHGRLKILKASQKKTSITAESKEEDKENRLTCSVAESVSNDAPKDVIMKPEGDCTLTLVPTELPGGGVAFVLSGNTQKLLQEWGTLSVQTDCSIPLNVSTCTTPSVAHTSPPNTSTGDHFISPKSERVLTDCTASTSITSSESGSESQECKLFSISHASTNQTHYSSLTTKPQGKPHCPPTPPPSPPTNNPVKTSSSNREIPPAPVQVCGAGVKLVEERMEVDYVYDEPFDLSMSRVWRPW